MSLATRIVFETVGPRIGMQADDSRRQNISGRISALLASFFVVIVSCSPTPEVRPEVKGAPIQIGRIMAGDEFSVEHVRNELRDAGIDASLDSDFNTALVVKGSDATRAKRILVLSHQKRPSFSITLLPEKQELLIETEYSVVNMPSSSGKDTVALPQSAIDRLILDWITAHVRERGVIDNASYRLREINIGNKVIGRAYNIQGDLRLGNGYQGFRYDVLEENGQLVDFYDWRKRRSASREAAKKDSPADGRPE